MARTERDIQASRDNLRRELTEHAAEVIQGLHRECPGAMVLNRTHEAAILRGGFRDNRGFLLARHYVLLGLMADGWSAAEAGAPFGMDALAVIAERNRDRTWRVPLEYLESLPEGVRELVELVVTKAEPTT